jgi:hypothetical protein
VIGNAQTSILTESAARQVFISFQLGAKLSGGRCEGEEGEREKRRRSRRR